MSILPDAAILEDSEASIFEDVNTEVVRNQTKGREDDEANIVRKQVGQVGEQEDRQFADGVDSVEDVVDEFHVRCLPWFLAGRKSLPAFHQPRV
jgi:hypothetical protein